jgi:hypothetical protein
MFSTKKRTKKKRRKEELTFLDINPHVKKPIRGGGGNQKQWEQ